MTTKKSDFAFAVTQAVKLKNSGENGEVRGRAEYAEGESQYWLRYVAADGRLVEAWWGESAIEAA